MNKRYEECSNYILNIPKMSSKSTPEDTRTLCHKVYKEGSAKVVHIAGTNGKGSTTSYLNSILVQMGYTVGMFTSPHLVSMTERIKINGVNISPDEFVKSFDKVMELIKEGVASHPSFFEFIFLMAMDYFTKNKVDYILLETGLGGRLDATNCLIQKNLCVITKIGMDHMEYLGNTIEDIAREKAGIVKEGVPVVVFDNHDAAFEVISNVAQEQNSMCYPMGAENIKILLRNKQIIDFSVGCSYYRLGGLRLNTAAQYQIYNASLAIMAAYLLEEDKFSEQVIAQGLLNAYWPGRMEQILPNVYIDGGHNVDGIEAFLNSIQSLNNTESDDLNDGLKHRLLLFSVVKDKEYDKMTKMIADSQLFDRIYVAPLLSDRRVEVSRIKDSFISAGVEMAQDFPNVESAYEAARLAMKPGDELYIVGSLYLVGQIKAMNDKR